MVINLFARPKVISSGIITSRENISFEKYAWYRRYYLFFCIKITFYLDNLLFQGIMCGYAIPTVFKFIETYERPR